MRKVMAIAAVIIALTGCEQLNDSSTVTLIGISVDYNGGEAVHLTRTVDELKDDLTVTAHYSDGSAITLSKDEYTLDGILTAGTPAITVSYGGRTATFFVTVIPPPSPPTIEDITYTLEQTGGTDGAADSTGIVLTFSKSIDSFELTADDITVGERAAKDATATFTGSEKIWTLEPITVTHAGQATVTINKAGIYAGTIHVTVYKAEEIAATLTGITVTYNDATTIYQTTPLVNLKTDLTVTAQYSDTSEEYLSAHEYTLSVSGSGTLTVGTSTVTVTYIHDGVTQTGEFDVTVECDHDYEWKIQRAATVTVDGAETETCRVCGETGETHTLYATGTAGLNYELIDNNTAYRVNRGTNSMYAFSELHIPAYWRPVGSTHYDDYKPVTHIGVSANSSNNNAFGGTKPAEGENTALTSLTFAENSQLTTISNYAFQYCTYLSNNISIPESVTSIGYYAFQGCARLTGVTIPASLTSVGMNAFGDCSSLASVTIPEGVTEIGDRMFYNCTSLTGVTIPVSVTSFGQRAFENCTGLTSIKISDGVTKIGYYMFMGCTGLESVTIPASVTSIGWGAFENCTGLVSATFSEGATKIGDDMFEGCINLTSITIPASLTSIGGGAFQNCKKLINIKVDANNPNFTDDGPILYNKNKTKIIAWPSAAGSITIPASVTEISNYAFEGNTDITSVIISEGVTSIGSTAFAWCPNLTSITIPSTVTSIGSSAFYNCTSLVSVVIPEGVTEIKGGTFDCCTSLTSVTIPSTVTSIGNYAFNSCSSLTSVTLPDGVTSIGSDAFAYCSKLASINIPDGVTEISGFAFNNCSRLTSITIPDSVTSIGKYAFNSSALTSINIPASVKSIGDSAFSRCTFLLRATIAATTVGTTMSGINGNWVFSGCTLLMSVTFTADVTSIGSFTFNNCTALTSVTFEGTIDRDSFSTDAFVRDGGDLRAKFYATDSANGTPGTYKAPLLGNKVWTLQ